MKRFHYIDENNQETIDLIRLFVYATDYKLSEDEVIFMLAILSKYVDIKSK